MPRSTIVLLLLAISGAATAAESVRYEQGLAWDLQKKRLLYTESHWSRFENNLLSERTVLYRCADGTPFARKVISYAPSRLAPAFDFKDARLGYREGLRWKNGRASVWFDGSGGYRERQLQNSPDLVADAGFDGFIRSRWPQLLGDRRQQLQFAVPSRLDSYGFHLQRIGAAVYREQAAQIFRLGLDGWLGLVAPDIEVTYSSNGSRLLRFKGLSNIRDDDGGATVKALIEFPLTDREVPAAEKNRAQAVLLKSCQLS
ncbi:hypothetical protein [Arenimonas sp. GDDSR-1]|uniref:hypothetical protein n=1 Tax=Arenimonas sp. GDDSR-1 TaxID=2950125 RepID=UPI00262D5BC0|nr:hypothetical protein [Arenimonas sp. GDDSR-1]